MEQKLEALLDRLKACGSLVVALSGGVDSSTLAKAAALALGDKDVAVTARSELLAAEELADAKAMAKAAGIRHLVVDAHDLDDADIVKNDKERCYYCKRGRFQKLCAYAKENGFAFVADGGNLDDKGDYRPGMRAIEELAPTVISPFMECGWTKADIRAQARAWGLSVADKPSAACLASRVEYGLSLTPERLAQVEKAERIIRPFAKGQLRVRHHGNLARLEAEPEAFPEVTAHRKEIAETLKGLGFLNVTLDLVGYRM
ncbi:MAG: ATP-dependent sacrificial sulfur transferase LarE, partial [Schwartzia sp.]|nr:ATP-dependent sacrificial sulfur transferase LarE [Schwartzia sp. (in: firmicutes)]